MLFFAGFLRDFITKLGMGSVALVLLSGCASIQVDNGTSASDTKPATPLELATSLQVVKVLSDDVMAGRAAGTAGNVMARNWLIEQLSLRGVSSVGESYEHEFSFELSNGDNINGTNILALIPGSKTEEKKTIVVSAHYDHVGVINDEIHNGADDNASGVAGVLAVADAFLERAPQHNIIIALFDAEENGLRGARAFLEDYASIPGGIALNINLDMISRSDVNELYVAGAFHRPVIREILAPVIADAPVNLLFGHDDPALGSNDWTLQSDHGPFHSAGIPFVYFGVEDHPHYHQPSDDFETIPQDFFLRSIQTIVLAGIALEQSADRLEE